jgi:hydrogenase maturation protease
MIDVAAKKNVLILGIGNILLRDEGLGVHIINKIMDAKTMLPRHAEAIDGGTAGFDLLEIMKRRKKIIIVDALQADDSPGSIYRFKPGYGVTAKNSFSLHETSILDVIKALRLLGENPDIEIVGIVPEDITTPDISISSTVKESIPKAVELILEAAANY